MGPTVSATVPPNPHHPLFYTGALPSDLHQLTPDRPLPTKLRQWPCQSVCHSPCSCPNWCPFLCRSALPHLASSSLTLPPRRLVGVGRCTTCQGESLPDNLRPIAATYQTTPCRPSQSSFASAAASRQLDVEGGTPPRGSQHRSSHTGPPLTPPRLALFAPATPVEGYVLVGCRGCVRARPRVCRSF
jgi:hypothetical protein